MNFKAPLQFLGTVPEVAFTPMVFFDGSYHPICGLDFWDSNDGAELVCEQLGYAPTYTGKITRTDAIYDADAMKVGNCNADDESVDRCTGGGNRFGSPSIEGGDCHAGNPIGAQVTCEFQQVICPISSRPARKCI
jgi:hypothetical protein